MQSFLIGIQYRSDTGHYVAEFSDGQDRELYANDYNEAVAEADLLIAECYE